MGVVIEIFVRYPGVELELRSLTTCTVLYVSDIQVDPISTPRPTVLNS
jgi:hypothetical protein